MFFFSKFLLFFFVLGKTSILFIKISSAFLNVFFLSGAAPAQQYFAAHHTEITQLTLQVYLSVVGSGRVDAHVGPAAVRLGRRAAPGHHLLLQPHAGRVRVARHHLPGPGRRTRGIRRRLLN